MNIGHSDIGPYWNFKCPHFSYSKELFQNKKHPQIAERKFKSMLKIPLNATVMQIFWRAKINLSCWIQISHRPNHYFFRADPALGCVWWETSPRHVHQANDGLMRTLIDTEGDSDTNSHNCARSIWFLVSRADSFLAEWLSNTMLWNRLDHGKPASSFSYNQLTPVKGHECFFTCSFPEISY